MMPSPEISDADRATAAKVGVAAIEAFYGSRLEDLDGDCQFLHSHLERLLKRSGFGSLKIETRSKGLDSVVAKLQKKCADPASNYCQRILGGETPDKIITDLVGVRITTQFSDQIDEVAELIKKNFSISPEECVDHRVPSSHDKFGYAALHIVANPIETTSTLIYFTDCKFEVQIRSALMDIWSVVNWDIAYKGESDVPSEILRRISTLSALFYLVDQEFTRIRDETTEVSAELARDQDCLNGFDSTYLSEDVASALRRRGIVFCDDERTQLQACYEEVGRYFEYDRTLEKIVQRDTLAVFLLDRERFSWIISQDVKSAVENIDRRTK